MNTEQTKQHLTLASECIEHFNNQLKEGIQKNGDTSTPIQIILSYALRIDAYTSRRYTDLNKQFIHQISKEPRKP